MTILLTVCLLLTGCAEATDDGDVTGDGSSSPTMGQTPRLASSLSDYIDGLIESQPSDTPMDESQKDMLERAKANGGEISVADYEEAWSNFKQCMVQLGYTTPVTIPYANGLYSRPVMNIEGMTSEQADKLFEDDSTCSFTYLNAVNMVYRLQVGNPSLEQDPYNAAVECIRQGKTLPADYGADRLREDVQRRTEGDDPELDMTDSTVVSCLVANGLINDDDHTKAWKPLG